MEETAGGSKIIKMGALLRELETLVLLDRVADVAMGDSVSPAGTCETYDVSESFLWRLSLAGARACVCVCVCVRVCVRACVQASL